MENNNYRYKRRWLWLGLLLSATLVLAACGGTSSEEATTTAETTTTAGDGGGTDTTTTTTGGDSEKTTGDSEKTTTSSAPAEVIVLDVQASQPENLNAERQIWDIYEAENPGVKIELFSINEDTLAPYKARRAGGYSPAIEREAMGPVDASNFQDFVNLLEVDFEWFDRFLYPVETASEDLTGVPGVYTLTIDTGRTITWQYNADLMDELGLDPRAVKTQADLKQLLADGTAAVAERDDIDFFWDQGWHNWIWTAHMWDSFPLAYDDGQRDAQVESWTGDISDAAEDPYRYTFEFIIEAYENGWLPDEFWLREWETDMEASYIAGKSVMMLHGPWTWDKMLAANPDARQLGIPSTPPVNEGDQWYQSTAPLDVNNRYRIPIENMDKPEWEQVLHAFNWWYSPDVVLLRAEINGVGTVYRLDEPLELEGPQWNGIMKEFLPGGFYEDVKIATETTGAVAVTQFKNEDAGNYWDWQWNGIYSDLVQGNMTVAEALAWFHEQVANDFDLP